MHYQRTSMSLHDQPHLASNCRRWGDAVLHLVTEGSLAPPRRSGGSALGTGGPVYWQRQHGVCNSPAVSASMQRLRTARSFLCIQRRGWECIALAERSATKKSFVTMSGGLTPASICRGRTTRTLAEPALSGSCPRSSCVLNPCPRHPTGRCWIVIAFKDEALKLVLTSPEVGPALSENLLRTCTAYRSASCVLRLQ